ncbi:DNA-binding bromodomain-containing protein [Prunus dulcis]|uniref:DNA-binding bromodomain-containing protein n=1 Tax=Prunus dulcis TaxID=3755 RepID=A0A4Y1RKD5_PRUDU|nr:DNA-binding bromodomain-containing protein [Prunus dulcis]
MGIIGLNENLLGWYAVIGEDVSVRHMSVTIEDKIWVKSLMKGSLCLRGVVGSTREFKYEDLRGYNYNPSNSPAPKEEESERYKSLIRQHMDLHEVQSRLNKGVYTDCTHKFFRDLLLLFNNAVVFLRKTSPEHMAAQELRAIVLKEMTDQLPKPQPAIDTVKLHAPKTDSSVKPSKPSIVVCGLRRSAHGGGGAKNRKGDKRERGEVEEKGKASEVEDKGIRKKRTQERGGPRGSRRGSSKIVGKTEHAYGGNELSSHDGLEEMKMEKIENAKTTKQGAARTFLKRMKQNSTSTVVKRGSSDVSEGGESEDSMVEEEEKKQKGRRNRTRGKRG